MGLTLDLASIYARQFEDVIGTLAEGAGVEVRCTAAEWHAGMSRPLEARYGKAFLRLTGKGATCHAACAYRDETALGQGAAAPFSEAVSGMGAGEKATFWEAVGMLNDLAAKAEGGNVPAHPKREEIDANIKAHRRSKGGNALHRSFTDAVGELAGLIGAEAPEEGAMRAWQRFDAEVGLCGADAEKLRCLDKWPAPASKEAICKALDEKEGETVAAVANVAAMVRVQANVPTNLLSKIETCATKLAGEISAGNADLASIDLQKLGQDVLAGTSQADVQALTQNLGALLPGLQAAMR